MLRTSRFSLLALFVATLCSALVLAFYSNPSVSKFIVVGVILCQVAASIARYKSKNASSWAALTGLVWSAAPVVTFALVVFVRKPKFHGQLYDEDGPYGFVVNVFTLFVLACISGSFVGAIIGAVTKYFPIKYLRSAKSIFIKSMH